MHQGVPAGGYGDLVLFLATAGIVVPLFKRLRLSPVLGFLAAGVTLGPYGLGALAASHPWLATVTVRRPADIAAVARFGVVFLLFMIGLELSWERLRLLRRAVFGLGAAQLVLCAGAIAGCARLFGQPPEAALAVGAALALSSTAIVMPVLAEAKRLHSEAGRAAFAVLLLQDLAVAPIMVVLGLLGATGAGPHAGPVWGVIRATAGLVLLAVAGRLLLRPILRSVAKAKSEELFVAACLLVVIGAGLISALMGLSMALGAFVAGLLLAETEYRHEVEVTIEPFKGLLLGLFFLSVGADLDLSRLAAQPLLILALALALICGKAVLTFAAGAATGLRAAAAAEAALPLAACGEFAFVVLGPAVAGGVAPQGVGQSLMVAATLTMFAIPSLGALGARIGRGDRASVAETVPVPSAADARPGAVLVIGYGRVGRLVATMLSRHGIDWAAADRDARAAQAGRAEGQTVFFGDAARAEFLRRMGLATARALVVTTDEPEAAEAVVATARAERPDLTIVARARDALHAQRLYELGATDAVPETIEASLQLSEAVLVDIGTPMGLVIASIHERRDEYRKLLNRPDALGARGRRAREALERGGER